MKHTTEPWHVCKPTEALHAVRAEAGRIVADVGYSDTDAQNRMNARRIVACVNACAGVTTEELEQGGFVTGLIERLEEKERQRDALQEELENIATAEWREFDPDTRRCAYEFVLWAQSRARHTLNRVLSGDVTAPLPEDVKLVQVGPCSCSDHECGECMQPAPKVGAGTTPRPPTPTGWSDTDWIKHLQEQQHPLAGLHINQGSMDAAADAYEAEYNARHNAK